MCLLLNILQITVGEGCTKSQIKHEQMYYYTDHQQLVKSKQRDTRKALGALQEYLQIFHRNVTRPSTCAIKDLNKRCLLKMCQMIGSCNHQILKYELIPHRHVIRTKEEIKSVFRESTLSLPGPLNVYKTN